MRILHFINTPIGLDDLTTGGVGINATGTWIVALLSGMLKSTNYDIACVAYGNIRKVQVSNAGRITNIIVPGDLVGTSMDNTLSISSDMVGQWGPDLIHFHGTENSYGLLPARKMVECPALVSLQGLLGPCSEWYRYFGNNNLLEIMKMHRLSEFPAMRGLWVRYLNAQRMAKREREIIAGNRFFMGRTEWDKSYIRALNQSARYFHGGEMLRDAFWHERWDIGRAGRYRVIFTNAGGYPRKGIEVLLDAVKLLRPDYPDIQVAIAGGISRRSGYGRYLRRRIEELSHAAVELGPLSAEEMVRELVGSHVFVSPSYIDNSPNSVCEAQLLGMPVISTYTGGVPSLIGEGRTGLFFPTGDAQMLASRLREIFEDDDLAMRLGNQAHEVASKRHDPDVIMSDVVSAYNEILGITV